MDYFLDLATHPPENPRKLNKTPYPTKPHDKFLSNPIDHELSNKSIKNYLTPSPKSKNPESSRNSGFNSASRSHKEKQFPTTKPKNSSIVPQTFLITHDNKTIKLFPNENHEPKENMKDSSDTANEVAEENPKIAKKAKSEKIKQAIHLSTSFRKKERSIAQDKDSKSYGRIDANQIRNKNKSFAKEAEEENMFEISAFWEPNEPESKFLYNKLKECTKIIKRQAQEIAYLKQQLTSRSKFKQNADFPRNLQAFPIKPLKSPLESPDFWKIPKESTNKEPQRLHELKGFKDLWISNIESKLSLPSNRLKISNPHKRQEKHQINTTRKSYLPQLQKLNY